MSVFYHISRETFQSFFNVRVWRIFDACFNNTNVENAMSWGMGGQVILHVILQMGRSLFSLFLFVIIALLNM